MRVDLFLKKTRLIKRRSQAKIALNQNIVFIDDKPLKPSYNVKVDDILTLKFFQKTLKIKVVSIDKNKEDYQIISEENNE